MADRLCRDRHEVWGLARSGRPLPDGVARIVGDLHGDVAFAHRFDAVCHLAALVRARESLADPVGYWRTATSGGGRSGRTSGGSSPMRTPRASDRHTGAPDGDREARHVPER